MTQQATNMAPVVFGVDDDIDVLCWIIQLATSNRTPCPKLRESMSAQGQTL